jgi:hypothetical protein
VQFKEMSRAVSADLGALFEQSGELSWKSNALFQDGF